MVQRSRLSQRFSIVVSAALLAATVVAAERAAAPESASMGGGRRAHRDEVRVWTAGALATVLAEVGADFELRTGYALVVTSDLPNGFERRARADEPFDVLITVSAPLDQWIRDGRIVATTRTDIARSGIGVAVREHTPKPDIGSVGIVVITQIVTTPGVALAGPLPPEVQSVITFSAGVSATSSVPKAARDLIAFLTEPRARAVIQAQGMEPAR